MGASWLLRRIKDGEATAADFEAAIAPLRGTELDLVCEAESLFRAGLVDEAVHRMKLWTEPKFGFGDAESRYAAHMKAQRAAQSPTSGDVP